MPTVHARPPRTLRPRITIRAGHTTSRAVVTPRFVAGRNSVVLLRRTHPSENATLPLVDATASVNCRLCRSPTRNIGHVVGRLTRKCFQLRSCPACGFVFVANPWTDFDAIYGKDYYRGKGADPLTDYCWESDNPDRTVRQYEWAGILERVASLTSIHPHTAWLDYGCGTGGLVSYLIRRGLTAVGYDQGWGLENLSVSKIPHLTPSNLSAYATRFDVISAIEVVEHLINPIQELRQMRALLRPGGLLFLTTGNVEPYVEKIHRWRYVIPEVHVSFFRPSTLAYALKASGFVPAFPGYGPGWESIMRYKILKNLRRREVSRIDEVVPWKALARLADRRARLSAHPIGWAEGLSGSDSDGGAVPEETGK